MVSNHCLFFLLKKPAVNLSFFGEGGGVEYGFSHSYFHLFNNNIEVFRFKIKTDYSQIKEKKLSTLLCKPASMYYDKIKPENVIFCGFKLWIYMCIYIFHIQLSIK